MSVGLFMILTSPTRLGADAALLRCVARFRALDRGGDVRSALAAALIPVALCTIGVAVGMFLAAPRLASIFFSYSNEETATSSIKVLSLFLPAASVATVALAGIRGFGAMGRYVLLENIGLPLLRFLCVAALAISGASLVSICIAWGAPLVLECGAAVMILLLLVQSLKRQ